MSIDPIEIDVIWCDFNYLIFFCIILVDDFSFRNSFVQHNYKIGLWTDAHTRSIFLYFYLSYCQKLTVNGTFKSSWEVCIYFITDKKKKKT